MARTKKTVLKNPVAEFVNAGLRNIALQKLDEIAQTIGNPDCPHHGTALGALIIPEALRSANEAGLEIPSQQRVRLTRAARSAMGRYARMVL